MAAATSSDRTARHLSTYVSPPCSPLHKNSDMAATDAACSAPAPALLEDFDAIVAALTPYAESDERVLVAIAGPPGVGKSTLAAALEEALPGAMAVGMDGFHLHNDVLDARGWRSVKGAPKTFDVDGLASTLTRLATAGPDSPPVVLPTFDRAADVSLAGAIVVPPPPQPSLIIVEGNYLIADDELAGPGWSDVARNFTASLYVDAQREILVDALLQRWRTYGLDEQAAEARALSNDIPNGDLVARSKANATWMIHRDAVSHAVKHDATALDDAALDAGG